MPLREKFLQPLRCLEPYMEDRTSGSSPSPLWSQKGLEEECSWEACLDAPAGAQLYPPTSCSVLLSPEYRGQGLSSLIRQTCPMLTDSLTPSRLEPGTGAPWALSPTPLHFSPGPGASVSLQSLPRGLCSQTSNSFLSYGPGFKSPPHCWPVV